MLEKLDDVPWSDLHHAYGPAEDVPAQLRALLSDDADVRKRSLWSLTDSIVHQGVRYKASAPAVPFLLEMVAASATPSRPALIELLVALAIGHDEPYLPGGFPLDELRSAAAGGEALLRDGGGRPERFPALSEADHDRLQARIELDAYEAVAVGVPVFTMLLSDADPAVRRTAAYALGWFHSPGSVPALTDALGDADQSAAATAALSLGLLASDDALVPVAAVAALRALFNSATTDARDVEHGTATADPRGALRGAAAIALARVSGRAAPREVVDELLRFTSAGPVTDVPYFGGDLAGYAARSLRLVLGDDSGEALDVLLGRLPAVSGAEALPVVGEALRRAFPEGATSTPFDDLSERQKQVVRALAGSPSAWQSRERASGDFLWLIGGYGLPSDATAMRAYAGMASTP